MAPNDNWRRALGAPPGRALTSDPHGGAPDWRTQAPTGRTGRIVTRPASPPPPGSPSYPEVPDFKGDDPSEMTDWVKGMEIGRDNYPDPLGRPGWEAARDGDDPHKDPVNDFARDDHGLPGVGMGSMDDDLKDQKSMLIGDPRDGFNTSGDVGKGAHNITYEYDRTYKIVFTNPDGTKTTETHEVYRECDWGHANGNTWELVSTAVSGDARNPRKEPNPNPDAPDVPSKGRSARWQFRQALGDPARAGWRPKRGGATDDPTMRGGDTGTSGGHVRNQDPHPNPGYVDPSPEDDRRAGGGRMGVVPPKDGDPHARIDESGMVGPM